MADYDLVILGGALEGRIAATAAVAYGARVALVEPPGLFEDRQRQRCLLEGLQQLGGIRQGQRVGEWFGYQPTSGSLDWAVLVKWSLLAARSKSAALSVAAMSARGVDVVLETPRRLSRRTAVFTESRRLTARSVLAAYGSVPAVASLWETSAIPEFVKVMGCSALSLTWAEALAGIGIDVRWCSDDVLLNADEDIKRLVRSQFDVLGIGLSFAGDRDDLALQIGLDEPTLVLPNFVYARKPIAEGPYLKVNRKLQTHHPRVFACGSALSPSMSDRMAKYQAKVAVRNALFLPTVEVDVDRHAVVQGYGRYAWVGLTQAEAVRLHGSRQVQVWAASDADSTTLSRVLPLPAYCKLVCAGDRLLGIHLLGEGAEGLVVMLAENLGQPIVSFGQRCFSKQGLEGLFMECIERSRQSQWQLGQWRRDWAENWFNWRRSRR